MHILWTIKIITRGGFLWKYLIHLIQEKYLDAKMISRIEESKNETLRWFIGIAIAFIGAIAGIMVLLFKYFIVQ